MTKHNISLLFSLTFFLCFLNNNALTKTHFDFTTLTLNNLKLLGQAHLTNSNTIHLTSDLPVPTSSSGRALYSSPIPFRHSVIPTSFSTFFTFSVTNLNPSSIGGGLAFIIVPDDEVVGAGGGFLGVVDETAAGGLGCVGVEFDTMMDSEFMDVNGNHVGLDLNGVVSVQVGDLDGVGVDLKSGELINVWIEYSGTSRVLNVSVSYSDSKPDVPVLSFGFDLERYVSDFMFVGFSGSTQGSTEVHSIEWWSFSSEFDSEPGRLVSPQPVMSNFTNPSANTVKRAPPPVMGQSGSNLVSRSGKLSSCHNELCKENPGAIAGVVSAGAFFLAIFAGGLVWLYSKKVKGFNKSGSFASEIIKMPKEFSYKELRSATKSFDANRIIGHGAFGTVYKGILAESSEVAVKRCSHSSQGSNEFTAELSIIGTIRHRNLVQLQGWCHEKGEILLVYDLMPNGSLDKALFESRMPLTFPHRRKILLGVASALAYLHQECENQVIHRDVKTSNIMLDEGFNARLGDFGLAKQIEHDKSPEATVAAGTMGYLAPEYLLTGRATEKTDVFSYGAVVLEVASGRRPIEKEDTGVGKVGVTSNLVDWVWGLHREGRLLLAADPRLGSEFDETEMRRLLMVGLACSHPDPSARPTMRAVVQMLAGEAALPIVPSSKPSTSFSTSHLFMCLQDSVSDYNDMINITNSNSSSEVSLNGDDIV